MDDIETIDDPERLKALSDPRRIEMLKLLVEEAHTVGDLAEKLETERNQLYYHLSRLEDLDLVEVVDEERKGNLVEKKYASAAEYFTVDRQLFADLPGGAEMLLESVTGLFDAARLDLQRLLREAEGERGLLAKVRHTQQKLRIPEDAIEDLYDDMVDLLDDYVEAEGEEAVEMTLVLHPTPTHVSESDGENDGEAP